MNSFSNRLESFIDDPRVRIAGPVLALAVTVGFLIFGNVTSAASYAGKAVSVLPDQPLNLGPSVSRAEAVDGAAQILAWQQPSAAKPAAAKPAAPANAKTKGKKGTLTARR